MSEMTAGGEVARTMTIGISEVVDHENHSIDYGPAIKTVECFTGWIRMNHCRYFEGIEQVA